jgi:peptidoglycan/LPS O-acetylase OafA/YrhL
MAKPGGLPHVPQLDGVRAIAVTLVFLGHCGLDAVIPGGLGVTIFFFLSGYLITSLLRSEAAQTKRVDLTAFYLRRTFRIWPPLYITMALSAAATLLWLPSVHVDIGGTVAQALFASNYASLLGMGEGIPSLPLWSLAVEEHFYLIFPLLFALWLRRLPPAQAARWCLVGCAAVLAVRVITAFSTSELGQIYYWTHTRIDSILFGCCLALWQNPLLDRRAWRPSSVHVGLAFTIMLLCLFARDEVFRQTLRYSLQGAALFVIFSWLLQSRNVATRLLSSTPARRIGLYSYTLYLVHRLIIALTLETLPGLAKVWLILIAGTGSILYAAAMYRLIERPMATLRRSLHTSDRDATVVST